MATYTWIIGQLNTKAQEEGLTDVVVTVDWTRNAQEYIGEELTNLYSSGTMGCTTPSPTDFTAYPDLTYNQVCGWLDAGLPVAEIDLGLQQQIDNIINPPVIVLPLPWEIPTNYLYICKK